MQIQMSIEIFILKLLVHCIVSILYIVISVNFLPKKKNSIYYLDDQLDWKTSLAKRNVLKQK